jgi:hypothetical protein
MIVRIVKEIPLLNTQNDHLYKSGFVFPEFMKSFENFSGQIS